MPLVVVAANVPLLVMLLIYFTLVEHCCSIVTLNHTCQHPAPLPPFPPLFPVSQICYLGSKSHEERQAFLKPLRALGPVVDTVGKVSGK
jgi:hypothetical protein